jgi:hypothetical protein
MYHAIGKELYDDLPAMFANAKFANTLTEDHMWWGYTYMFPHNTRDTTCTVEMYIKFTKSDGTFKKVYCPVESQTI